MGVAVPDELNAWRLAQLKKMGSNAIRTSHNPPTPELLDACDRLGMMVMDENRREGINAAQLDELESMMRRDRNHPCVVIWSLGNEEFGIEGNAKGTRVTQTMQTFAQNLDPTRRFTVAISGGWGWGSSRSIDVMGLQLLHPRRHGTSYHAKFPQKPSVATEDGSTFSTRGIYFEDSAHQHLTAYDENKPAGATWRSNPGRITPRARTWPAISSGRDLIIAARRRRISGGRRSVRNLAFLTYAAFPRTISITTRPGGGPAGAASVSALELAGQGRPGDQCLVRQQLRGSGTVPQRPEPGPQNREDQFASGLAGQIRPRHAAGARLQGRQGDHHRPGRDHRRAGGRPDYPHKSTIKADGEDVAVITVQANDAQGRLVPTASNEIDFAIAGPGRIIGVGNGDPSSHEAGPIRAQSRVAAGDLAHARGQQRGKPARGRV